MATVNKEKKQLEDAPVNDPARVPVSFGARTASVRPPMAAPLPRTAPVPPTPSTTFVPGSVALTESKGEFGVSRGFDVTMPRFETKTTPAASPVEQAFSQRTKTLANASDVAAAPVANTTGQQPPAYLSNPSGALYRNPAHPDTPNYIPKDFDLAKANTEWDARLKASEAAETRGVDFGRRLKSQSSGSQGDNPIQITKQPNGVTEIWDRTSGLVEYRRPGDGDFSATNRHMAQLTSGDPAAYADLMARANGYEAGLKNADTGAFRGETERSLVPSQIRENNARAQDANASAAARSRKDVGKEPSYKPFTQANEDGSEKTLFYNEADPTKIIDPTQTANTFETHLAEVEAGIAARPDKRDAAIQRLKEMYPQRTKIVDKYFAQ